MAISKHAETTFEQNTGANLDVSLPGTPAENDIVIVCLANDSAITGDIITSGYNLIDSGSTSVPGMIVAWKRMGASPDANVTIGPEGTAPTAGLIQIFRGVDTTTAIDNTPVGTVSSANGSPDPGSFTTTTANAVRIIVGAMDDDVVTTVTPPSGYGDSLFRSAGGDTNAGTIMIASKLQVSAGAENPAAWTTDGSDAWRAWHFALRNAVAVVPTLVFNPAPLLPILVR